VSADQGVPWSSLYPFRPLSFAGSGGPKSRSWVMGS
jgi:hypothetical protein